MSSLDLSDKILVAVMATMRGANIAVRKLVVQKYQSVDLAPEGKTEVCKT